MASRRHFVSVTLAGLLGRSFGQTNPASVGLDGELPPLPKALLDASGEPDFFSMHLGVKALGTADPGKDLRDFARSIMSAAPKNCAPIEVAYFFRDLGLGKTQFKEEGRPFARGWPRIYNPVIVELFKTTGLNPLSPTTQGDATPWCAAFVNYCIARASSKTGVIGAADLAKGTRSASSGSFRCFGKSIDKGASPKEGDIAVWALDGTIDKCKPGSGHVGFYVGNSGDAERPILVMGGNQSGDLLKDTKTRNDGMFLKGMPLKYVAKKSPLTYKTFYGFRTSYFS